MFTGKKSHRCTTSFKIAAFGAAKDRRTRIGLADWTGGKNSNTCQFFITFSTLDWDGESMESMGKKAKKGKDLQIVSGKFNSKFKIPLKILPFPKRKGSSLPFPSFFTGLCLNFRGVSIVYPFFFRYLDRLFNIFKGWSLGSFWN